MVPSSHTIMSLKDLRKLADKKYRTETGLFLVEGKKNILELLASDFVVETLYITLEASSAIDTALDTYRNRMKLNPESIIVTEEKLASLGTFQSNNAGVAIARQRTSSSSDEILTRAKSEYVLVLDDVRDPGNLGTIIRTADWFGISHIVVSESTTDFYNPKTISASMGSFTRVHVTPLSLVTFFTEAKQLNIPSFGAFLDGKDTSTFSYPPYGLIIMGSESHGISDELELLITERITIPRYGKAESLNVAVATAIVLSSLRKQ